MLTGTFIFENIRCAHFNIKTEFTAMTICSETCLCPLLLVNANIGIRQENVIVRGFYVIGKQLTYRTTVSSCAYMPNLRSKKRTTLK